MKKIILTYALGAVLMAAITSAAFIYPRENKNELAVANISDSIDRQKQECPIREEKVCPECPVCENKIITNETIKEVEKPIEVEKIVTKEVKVVDGQCKIDLDNANIEIARLNNEINEYSNAMKKLGDTSEEFLQKSNDDCTKNMNELADTCLANSQKMANECMSNLDQYKALIEAYRDLAVKYQNDIKELVNYCTSSSHTSSYVMPAIPTPNYLHCTYTTSYGVGQLNCY